MSGRKTQGFTLVELLVVIAIIGLLISLLLPAIRGMVDSGASGACAANMRQIGAAATQWASDWSARLPPFEVRHDAVSYSVQVLGSPAQSWTDYGILGQYLGNDRLQSPDGFISKTSSLICPADREANPFSAQSQNVITSYGMNARLLRQLLPGETFNDGTPLSRVHPASTILAIDSHRNRWHAGHSDTPPCYGMPEPAGGFSWSPGAPNSIDNWAMRHRDQQGANVVFVDGRVAAVVGDELRERVANRTYRVAPVH